METKISQWLDSVTSFFNPGQHLPKCNRDIILGCEKEVAEVENTGTDEQKIESIMRLSWALVHSTQLEDVQRGITMLEASLSGTNSPSQKSEKLYLLSVGCYRSGEYSRSLQLVEKCLEIKPDWRQALYLEKTVIEQITKDGVIGIGISVTTVGLIAGGIITALASRKS
ncbi:mitochondrial fission 1 protein A-like [Coffea eugenioides]|uniref:mitochondrial fission 1 protein A-like n=1 Tax=Coffea eugenioides TaxID=49369 RepID=UPI000F60891C|nr:mitochondrial fission 1 protein A-like [Coffea eugenioides]